MYENIKNNNSNKLPLVEEFYSIQGEGYNTGKPAYFIRVGGCDIGCEWCDSKLAWDAQINQLTSIDDIIRNAKKYPAKAVVVTGGEPLLYNLDYLCIQLKKFNIKTFIETSGSHNISGIWNWICLSPKKTCPPLPEIYDKADELKVIIKNPEDFEWAEENAKKVSFSCKLFLQPEWSNYKKIIQDIVDYVKVHPQWNISLQSHKFMNIP